MFRVAVVFAQVAAGGHATPPPVVLSSPTIRSAILPASAKAVADHLDALYRGDVDGALAFVADDVENGVSDLNSKVEFPSGRPVTKAMYLSITRKGASPLSWFACRPEAGLVRCDMLFGSGAKVRDFTFRYRVDGGPITQVLSWENHPRKRKDGPGSNGG